MGSRTRFLIILLIITNITVSGDRRKIALTCIGQQDSSLDPVIVAGRYAGDFLDFNYNERQQSIGNHGKPEDFNASYQRIHSRVNYNEKVDVSEVGSPSPAALAQEGRSFCISGEHYRNTPELLTHFSFRSMRALALQAFDIGTHVNPNDYTLMNTFNWPDHNLPANLPAVPGPLTILAEDNTPIHQWEPTEETFFHTRLSRETQFPARTLNPGFRNRPAEVDNQPSRNCRNPYFIDVTEIDANGVRLHNWLHITVYVRRENIIHGKNCATGRMRYIMLEVRDSLGLPVGDFNGEMDCGTSCKCKSANCKMLNGNPKYSMPCMFTPLRAITQPGIFMYAAPKGEYFDEVHVTWRMSQQTSYFVHQLHFAALIVENPNVTRYYTSRQTKYEDPLFCRYLQYTCSKPLSPGGNSYGLFEWTYTERPGTSASYYTDSGCNTPIDPKRYSKWASRTVNPDRPFGYYSFTLQHMANKTRPYGWTAQYTRLSPTIQTLGAWDYFQKQYVQISRMNCHKKVDNDFFEEGEFLKGRLPRRTALYNWVQSYPVYLSNHPNGFGEDTVYRKDIAIRRASSDKSDFHTKYEDVPLTTDFGLTNDTLSPNLTHKAPKFYFGTQFTREDYAQYSAQLPAAIKHDIEGRELLELIAERERCACPAVGTTEDPEAITRPVQILQGRKSHALQMFLAWIVLVPIGLFTIRYYKETYSRVFLMQEFWWYAVHALCMGTAWMFMLGGIYAIEIKRLPVENYKLSDEAFVHIILGYAAIGMFTLQFLLAPIRLWSVYLRLFQITLHFTFGMVEYMFAAACILLAAAIPQGRMSCAAFYLYVSYLLIQATVYLLMELHMGYVDKLLDLFPRRSYLPPPVVRLFHTSAPLSKMRIYILGFYTVFCWIYFHIMQHQVTTEISSCFKELGNDYEEEAF